MEGIIIAAAVIAALILLWIYLIMPGKRKKDSLRPFEGVIFADRGVYDNSSGAPENSLPAIRAAVEKGYGVAIDVRMTQDSEIIVLHDEELDRVCGEQEWADGLTADMLSGMRLFGTDEGIPTLSHVLEEVDGKVPLLITVGRGTRGHYLCAKIDTLMKKYGGAWCVQSESASVLSLFRKRAPGILRGQMSASRSELKERWNGIMAFIIRNVLGNYLSRPNFIACTRKGESFSVKAACALGAARFEHFSSKEEAGKALAEGRCTAALVSGDTL